MNMMQYKGYLGTVEYSSEDRCLHGKLAYIRDLILYEGDSVTSLELDFHAAVDDYLASCERKGKAPNRPFKGSFNVRTGHELHRAAVLAAGDKKLNQFVCEAIQEKLERTSAV